MAKKPTLHLICNAHLDPVWLWQWQEGAAEAMSTFRTAAEICEQFDGFVFNHNEVILYQWIQAYEPQLFRRIQRLVETGKWHIMGAWYVQPDCNMPSGESFVRQILVGRSYFKKYFGATPRTAINFDPFGHSRGLVQILAKTGFDSYLFGRPEQEDCPLEADAFTWVGFDGSEVLARRFDFPYHSLLGQARAKVEQYLVDQADTNPGLVLWGMGNHGGGPSRQDTSDLERLIAKTRDRDILHSTPEAYFRELRRVSPDLPRRQRDLNAWAVGCYTSQVRVKQKHRQLENAVYSLEKMAATATGQGLAPYPRAEIQEALQDLLTAQFHDILPGSSIAPAEEDALRLLDHGLEICSRAKARCFFALAQGQPPAKAGQIPVLVYNPHPYPVRAILACEFNLPNFNVKGTYHRVQVMQGRKEIPSQVEQELSHLPMEWRKRVVFSAELAPGTMNRFDCHLTEIARKPILKAQDAQKPIRFRNDTLDVTINRRTGLIDCLRIQGRDYLSKGALAPTVMEDNADPWGMMSLSFSRIAGKFKLMSPTAAARFCAVKAAKLAPVRIIEQGPARTIVEALFVYENSTLVQRYHLPAEGSEIELTVTVHWQEKERMLKLTVPTPFRNGRYLGQVAYGVQDLPTNGNEAVAHQWVAAVDNDGQQAVTCINDGSYGSDFKKGLLRLTLLRSPAYAAHPIRSTDLPHKEGQPGPGFINMPQDRYSSHSDQGVRSFRFWLNAGPAEARLARIDREALAKNETPEVLSFFPAGDKAKVQPLIKLDDDVVQIRTVKQAEKGNDLIIRLFEPTGQARRTTVSLPLWRKKIRVTLEPFEIKTLRFNRKTQCFTEVNLLE